MFPTAGAESLRHPRRTARCSKIPDCPFSICGLLRVGRRAILGEMFERFTDRSRRVLVLAQEEARQLNHSFIGTEHILLGLIHEGDGVAARTLDSLGITLTAVRERVEEAIGMTGTVPSGAPPFTPRAKKVLELSLREALQLGHSYIGTEHMLLGLVSEGDGVAAQVLVSLGADLARVRQQVIRTMAGNQDEDATGASVVRLEETETWASLDTDLEWVESRTTRTILLRLAGIAERLDRIEQHLALGRQQHDQES
jgi:ATP-dependent Clp protease ATP-binding subunit ClpA